MEKKKYLKLNEEVPVEKGISASAVKAMLEEHKASVNETVAKVIDALDEKIEQINEDVGKRLEDTVDEVIEGFKNTPMVKGDKGKDADEEGLYTRLSERLPNEDRIIEKLSKQIPRIDDITKKVISKIPKPKGSLKVVTENVEIDPTAVIDKILAMSPDKFKLKRENIDGLEQTISAMHNQIGTRGYLHGSGLSDVSGLILAGTNITINGDGTQASPFIINSSGGGGGGSAEWGGITGLLSDQTDLQDALDAKQDVGDYITALTGDVTASGPGISSATIANNAITTAKILDSNVTDAKLATGINANKIADGSISNTEFQYLNGLTGNIQTQINNASLSDGDKGNITVSGSGTVWTIDTGVVSNSMLAGLISASKLIGTDIDTVGTITTGTWNGTDVAVTAGGTGASNASDARTNLGLAIGTNVQAYNAGLAQIAGLADPNADRILFWDDSTGSYSYLTAGSGLSISGTTLTALGAVTSVTANNGSLTISPTTGDVLAEVNLAHNYVWGGTHEFNSTAQFDGATSFTAGVTFTSLPTSSDTVTASNELVTKQYVDVFLQGLQYKGSVNVSTTTALPTNTYSNGASGVGATLTAVGLVELPTIDGETVTAGQVILVKNEATPANNGIYTVTVAGATGVTAYVLTRTTNFDESADIVQGAFVSVLLGTANGNTIWAMDSDSNPTVGTDPITFSQLSAPTQYTATLGVQLVGNDFRADLSASGAITLSGNSMQVAVDGSSIEISTNALQVKASGITNAMLAGSIADTKLNTITTAGKVDGSAIDNIDNLPAGAGLVPTDNLGTGVASGTTFLAGDQTYKTIDLTGMVVGPGSSTDNAMVTWDGTSGELVQNTDVIYSLGSFQITTSGTFSSDGTTTYASGGLLNITGAQTAASTTSNGYNIEILSGQGGADAGNGGDIIIQGGFAPGGVSGSPILKEGLGNGGTGLIKFSSFAGSSALFDLTSLDQDTVYTFPASGATGIGTFVVNNISNAWTAGFKQTFSPDATNAGINVGSISADPSSLSNGDMFYDSTTNELKARINGATVSLGASGSGDVTGPASSTDNAIARFDLATGKIIQDSSVTVSDVATNTVTIKTADDVAMLLQGGASSTTTGVGQRVTVKGGTSGSVSGTAGDLQLFGGDAGSASAQSGGVTIAGGQSASGTIGSITFKRSSASSVGVILNLANIASANRTYTAPNASGTLAISASGNIALSALGNITFTGTLPLANGGLGQNTLKPSLTGFTQTAIKSVANTVTETTLIGTGVGSNTYAANTLALGRTIRVKYAGLISTHSVLPTLTIRVDVGANTITELEVEGLTTSMSAEPFNGEATITIRSIGASGTGYGYSYFNLTPYTGGYLTNVITSAHVDTATAVVNTTISTALNVTAQWSAANAANDITITSLTVEILN